MKNSTLATDPVRIVAGSEQAGSSQQAAEAAKDVPLEDESVSTFVGWAYFDADGTFTMYDLDDTPKMQGDWTVAEDEFTYRVFPDENDMSVYVDIVHAPTDHAEPTS